MAETVASSKAKPAWRKSGMESSSSDDDAVVPGVNNIGAGNLRPKIRPRRPREVKPKVSGKKPAAEEPPSTTSLSVQDLSQSLDERRLGPAAFGARRRGQVSLKDLCVEDKQRIANLIKELAKVGEEREKAREDLERERKDYERQILKLVEQQEQILKERQDLERHFQECQQLLASAQPLQQPLPSHLLPSHPQPFPLPSTQLHVPQPPQWMSSPQRVSGAGLDKGQSMLANIGSPKGDAGSSSAGGSGDAAAAAAVHRYQQQLLVQAIANNNSDVPPGPSLHNPDPRLSAMLHNYDPQHPPPHLHHGLKHQREHQLHQQQEMLQYQQQHHHPQPNVDFFAGMAPEHLPQEPVSVPARNGKDAHLPSVPANSSKEEIINRFFASQVAIDNNNNNSSNRRSPSSLKRKDGGAKSRGKGSSAKPGAFLAPIMSSTQKSMEIGDSLSVDSRQEFTNLVPDKGGNGGGGAGGRGEEEEGRRLGAAGRVVFAEGEDVDGPLHSPPGEGGRDGMDTAHQYRKMSQGQRKEQLIEQRRQLLQEQQRLKQVLSEQEAMLKEKQRALSARSRHRSNNMDPEAEEGEGRGGGDEVVGAHDDDPLGLIPQRLAIDAALERQRAIVNSLEMEAEQRNSATYPKPSNSPRQPPPAHQVEGAGAARRNQPERLAPERDGAGGGGGEGLRRRKEERAVAVGAGAQNPVNPSNKLSDVVCKLEYTLHSDSEVGKAEEGLSSDEERSVDNKYEADDDRREKAEEAAHASTPQRQDAGTSVSYRTIPRSGHTSEDLGYTDRREGSRAFSASHPPPSRQSAALGEKTMSVLEIINSMGSPPPSHRRQHHQLSPPCMPKLSPRQSHKSSISPFLRGVESSPSTLPYRELPPLSKWRGVAADDEDSDVEIVVADSSGDFEDVEDKVVDGGEMVGTEDLEESQILEDIFFLK